MRKTAARIHAEILLQKWVSELWPFLDARKFIKDSFENFTTKFSKDFVTILDYSFYLQTHAMSVFCKFFWKVKNMALIVCVSVLKRHTFWLTLILLLQTEFEFWSPLLQPFFWRPISVKFNKFCGYCCFCYVSIFAGFIVQNSF